MCLDRHFSKEDMQMSNEYLRRPSTAPRNIKSEPKGGQPWLEQSGNRQSKCGQGCREMGPTTVLHWCRCHVVRPLKKAVRQYHQTLNMELQASPIPFLRDGCPRETRAYLYTRTALRPMAAFIHRHFKVERVPNAYQVMDT